MLRTVYDKFFLHGRYEVIAATKSKIAKPLY